MGFIWEPIFAPALSHTNFPPWSNGSNPHASPHPRTRIPFGLSSTFDTLTAFQRPSGSWARHCFVTCRRRGGGDHCPRRKVEIQSVTSRWGGGPLSAGVALVWGVLHAIHHAEPLEVHLLPARLWGPGTHASGFKPVSKLFSATCGPRVHKTKKCRDLIHFQCVYLCDVLTLESVPTTQTSKVGLLCPL